MSIFRTYILNNDLLNALNILDKDNQTILHYLCSIDDEELIISLLNNIKNNNDKNVIYEFINKQDINGNTALHIASSRGNNIVARILELYGANPNIENNKHQVINVTSESDEEIKCGDEIKMKELINKLTRPTKQEIKNVDTKDIVLTGGSSLSFLEKSLNMMEGGANKSTKIHDEVITKIRDLGYSAEEAKIYKAALYRYVKTENPKLNAIDRAKKMKTLATKKHLEDIDIMAVKQAIKLHFINKNKK